MIEPHDFHVHVHDRVFDNVGYDEKWLDMIDVADVVDLYN
jgi:hypothetical protein